MAKVKVEFDDAEAMSVSIAIGEYKRMLQAKKAGVHPNDTLAKAIVIQVARELGTAYAKLGKAMRGED